MKRLFICMSLVTIIFITATVSYGAQYWAKTYGGNRNERVKCIKETSDGGYILAGDSDSFGYSQATKIWILKLGSDGNIIWQKAYGIGELGEVDALQQTYDGGYIVAGLQGSLFNFNFWVLKLDSNGNVSWQKTYGDIDFFTAQSISQTDDDGDEVKDDGYIVTGITSSMGVNNEDIWVLKLNDIGDIIWQRTYGTSGWDGVNSIAQTLDGGYVIGGTINTSLAPGMGELLVFRLDNTGDVVWQKTYGEGITGRSWFLQQTSDEGYILTGSTIFGAGNGDIWVLKLESNGNVSWQKSYGGNGYDFGQSIQETIDGGYIIGGYYGSFGLGGYDIWMLKLDIAGNIVWQKTYGNSLDDNYYKFLSMHQTNDGGYIVAGETDSIGVWGRDFFMLKLNNNGEIPDCPSIVNTNAEVTNTSVIGHDTTLASKSTTASTTNTNITPQITSAKITTVCCYDTDDFDDDGIGDLCDNCPTLLNPLQEDTYPPQGNGIGDACDCECDFNCDGNVAATDVTSFLTDFGRSTFFNPCTNDDPCKGDVDCNVNVDANDVTMFLEDFGRSQFNNPCPSCVAGAWCVYP